METLVENLNRLGSLAREFAWPMLWQSSLLIGAVFLVDWGLRRQVRAAVRYALWWLVLIKLLLPPSLALPTGLGWWLRGAKPAPVQAQAGAVVVTYGAGEMLRLPTSSPTVLAAPAWEPLSREALGLLAASGISLGLLAWMLVRWRQAAGTWRRTAEAPVWLERLLEKERCALGLSRPLRLRLLDQAVSPAVCGLVRPVILLPKLLVEQLSREQLRAVLVHELVHLRRADVWANCVQALLQVVYWWHPLLWVANARIRRVREEAVDDAVLLALQEEAETYAPTLLQVAKLALQRPLATLGLVGILESRSFLRQRIERLVDGQPPRDAGLTLASIVCLAAVGALALPMGQEQGSAPAVPESATTVPLYTRIFQVEAGTFLNDLKREMGLAQSNGSNTTVQVLRTFCKGLGVELTPPKSIFLNEPAGTLFVRASAQDLDLIEREIVKRNQSAAAKGQSPAQRPAGANALVVAGKALYEQGKFDEAEVKLKQAIREDPQNQAAYFFLNLVSESRYKNRIVGTNDAAKNASAPTNRIMTSQGRQLVIRKLDQIRLGQVKFQAAPLGQVLAQLTEASRQQDPEAKGIRFAVLSNQAPTGTSIDPATGQPPGSRTASPMDIGAVLITIEPAMTEVRLADVLDAVIKGAGTRIKYSVENYGVNFSLKTGQEAPPLYTRMIKVDRRTFVENLRNALGLTGPADFKTLQQNTRDFFTSVGAELAPPKSVFFNDKEGTLVVRATLQDLDTIETATQVLNIAPPQINLKTMFLELPDEKVAEFWQSLELNCPTGSNAVTVLTAAQARKVRQDLEAKANATLLNEASVTTLSGRQTEIQQVDLMTVVTNINPQALKAPGIASKAAGSNGLYQTTSLPVGPTLDLVSYVGADGYTVQLTSIATLTEFLGYDEPTNSPTVYIAGKKERAVLPLPRLRVHSMTNSAVLWDGQTVLLSGPARVTVSVLKDKVAVLGDLPLVGKLFQSESRNSNRKQLMVLITATIIDPAGNRVHGEEEMKRVSGKGNTSVQH